MTSDPNPMQRKKPTRTEAEVFADLERLCTSPGYAHTLALLCFRDTYVRYKKELTPSDMDHMFSHSRLIRTEISTLTGLMVKQPVDFTHPGQDALQEQMAKTESLLEEIHEIMNYAMWVDMFGDDGRTLIPNPTKSPEWFREPIFYGGESAYGTQYRDIAVPKYSSDDAWLLQHKGFSIAEASRVVTEIAKVQDSKVMRTRRSLDSLLHCEWTMLPAFVLTPQELAERTGLEIAKTRTVLDAFSVPATGTNSGFAALNDYNAINGTPLLKKGPDEYVLFQQYSLFEALYESPFYWLNADKQYSPTALTHRGRFTEQFSYERLAHVFGKDNVDVNVDVWRKKGEKLGEIDVLVLFGNRAIVLQAKSKRLTLEARKGNDLQLKSDFKLAIQESYDQAHLCAAALTQQGITLTDAAGQAIQLRPPKVAFPVCIVADHYPALSAQAREFLVLKSQSGIAPPLVTDVFALDAMAEMLDTPLQFLNYLDLRARFGSKIVTMHEHIALSFHIKYNLWLSDEYNRFLLGDDIAADLDIAMGARREGISGRRTPEGILTRFKGTPIGRITSDIERLADPAMIDLGLLLLQMSGRSANSLNAGIRQIVGATKRDGKNHDITLGVGDAGSGLTVHCNDNADVVARSNLRSHCEARKYAQKANVWFGLVVEPEEGTVRFGLRLDYPWERDEQLEHLASLLPKDSARDPATIGTRAGRKIGRNAPCPCGSGKKYKRCCSS